MSRSATLADPVLSLLAAQLGDFEKFRVGAANRARVLTRPAGDPDEDGVCRGFGLPSDEPTVKAMVGAVEGMEAVERGLVLALQRRLRTHPLYPWVKSMHGVGEKTAARLLGTIGDPYWNTLHNRPRLVSELWAYCGLHGPKGRKRRGQKANWSQEAKVRAYLVIESCIKQDGKPDKNGKARALSPYRAAYDTAKAKVVDKAHTEPCPRCGPAGKAAPEGSPWSDGHRHGHAMRIAMKQLLLDVWTEAKRLHGGADV